MAGEVDIEEQIRRNNQAALLFLAANNPVQIFADFEKPGDTTEQTAQRIVEKVLG